MSEDNLSCGYFALVGRPNVGTSTLLNQLLQEKVSITSRRPQTTRHRILGIKSSDEFQIIFVDTPGMNKKMPKALNRALNKQAQYAISDVDVIGFVVERLTWGDGDEWVLECIKKSQLPTILIINKVDEIKKEDLLPHIAMLSKKYDFKAIIPTSALKDINVKELEQEIIPLLPKTDYFFYDAGTVTDKTERFRVAEMIREKIMRQLGDELPYSTTVQIIDWKQEPKIIRIEATIYVERDSQKAIVIGDGGARLKSIGSDARADIEDMVGQKVFLRLWTKTKAGWSDDERALKSLGYIDIGD